MRKVRKRVGTRRRLRRADFPGEEESVRCRLCRRDFKAVSISHVRYRHGIDLQEYVERFPGANIASAGTRRRLADRVRAYLERQGRRWTKARVRDEVLRRWRRSFPLNAQSAYRGARDLYEAACSLFGSWDRTLRAAGLRPIEVRRNRRWDARLVLREISNAHRAGELKYGARFLRRRPELAQAAVRTFGSWRAALSEAGLRSLAPPPTRWTRREVVARIRRRAERGESLSSRQVARHETALWNAARRLFAVPWCDLVRRLGYAYPGHESWSRDKVVRALRRTKRSARRLDDAALRRNFPNLAYAAGRYFGSWAAACRASGIAVESPTGGRPPRRNPGNNTALSRRPIHSRTEARDAIR